MTAPVLSGAEGPVLSGAEGPVLSGAEGPVLSGAEGPVLSGDFEPYSPGSRRWIDFAEACAQWQLVAELRRTLDAITATGAERIAKGQLTRPELETQMFLWQAIVADVDVVATIDDGPIGDRIDKLRAANGFSWTAKVAALRREIEARRRCYPADVDKGRLTPAEAKQQLERLEAVHYLYWNRAFAFDGDRAELRTHAYALSDALERQQEKAA